MAVLAEKAIGSDDQFTRPSAAAAAVAVAVAEEATEEEYKSDVRKLANLFTKLNPAAEEFYPSSYVAAAPAAVGAWKSVRLSANAPAFVASGGFYNAGLIKNGGGGGCNDSSSDAISKNQPNRTRKNDSNQGRRKLNRSRKAEREDSVRRTVYVSDIDQLVTEEKLAEVFAHCGQVVDCRICGDPHSALRFAFIEFSDEDGARKALSLGGTVLGYYPIKVLPSKTAIVPVNPKFLPKTNDEKELVVRTVYCTNIDKKVTQTEIKAFFEQFCGQVSRLRLLGDNIHSTRIAFVEFVQAVSAISALSYSGMILGSLPIRVSPSKTPVRPRMQRSVPN